MDKREITSKIKYIYIIFLLLRMLLQKDLELVLQFIFHNVLIEKIILVIDLTPVQSEIISKMNKT